MADVLTMNRQVNEMLRVMREFSKKHPPPPREWWLVPAHLIPRVLDSSIAAELRAKWPEMRTLCIDIETMQIRPLDFEVSLSKMPKPEPLPYELPLQDVWAPMPSPIFVSTLGSEKP